MTHDPVGLSEVAWIDLGDVPQDAAGYLLGMPQSKWWLLYGLCVTANGLSLGN